MNYTKKSLRINPDEHNKMDKTPEFTLSRGKILPKTNKVYHNTLSNARPMPGKLTWGAPIWIFFHTLAAKVKDSDFDKLKDGMFKLIRTVCDNLPCYMCQQHASEYMKRVNFIAIQNKIHLQKMLFIFHNNVNERLNYPQYSYDNINEYEDKIFIEVANEFMLHFQKRNVNSHLISQEIYRMA